jgi:hypothetical protein
MASDCPHFVAPLAQRRRQVSKLAREILMHTEQPH